MIRALQRLPVRQYLLYLGIMTCLFNFGCLPATELVAEQDVRDSDRAQNPGCDSRGRSGEKNPHCDDDDSDPNELGRINFDANEIVTDPRDQSIVIVGAERNSPGSLPKILRLHSTGHVDDSFETNLQKFTAIRKDLGYADFVALSLQSDGKIVAVGSATFDSPQFRQVFLVRFLANGILDTTFGTSGFVRTNLQVTNANTESSFANVGGIAIQPDHRIVVLATNQWTLSTGHFYGWDINLIRYLPDGSPDTSFGTNGIVTTKLGDNGGGTSPTESCVWGYSLGLAPNGKLSVAGTSFRGGNPHSSWVGRKFTVLQYTSSGGLDSSFGTNGVVRLENSGTSYTEFFSHFVQPDGKLVVGGRRTLDDRTSVVSRFKLDGSLDTSFGENGTYFVPNLNTQGPLGAVYLEFVQKVKPSANGDILALIYSPVQPRIIRLSSDGSSATSEKLVGPANKTGYSSFAESTLGYLNVIGISDPQWFLLEEIRL